MQKIKQNCNTNMKVHHIQIEQNLEEKIKLIKTGKL